MTEDEFEELLDRYGGDPEAWPLASREAAERLLRSSVRARAELAAMQAVEAALVATRTTPQRTPWSPPMEAARPRERFRPLRRRVAWAGLAAAALMLGFMSGQAAALMAAGSSPVLGPALYDESADVQ